MTTQATRSTDVLPVPREALLELGLSDEEIDGALDREPLVHTGAPRVDRTWFDVAAVRRVLKAIRALRHTKTRRWSGRPLDPEPWQVVWIIAPVFGWRYDVDHPNVEVAGTRVIRTVWVEVPRKNGKSTLASGLALVLLAADGEPGAEVYSAAGGRDQAGIVFGESKKMAMASPALKGRVDPLKDVLRYPKTGGVYRALSRVAEAAHGLNVHGGLIDEVHVHKSRDLIDAIETGTGARDQPLIVFITTADDGDNTSIYAEKHNYTRQVADRVVQDHTHYGVIWAADEDDDPFAVATLRKANPGLGVTVTEEYLRKEAAKAAEIPGYFPTYARLSLNRRIAVRAHWFNMQVWARGTGLVVEPDLAGRQCYGGMDLANTSDFAAWVLLFPPVDGEEQWQVLPRFWLPRAAVDRRAPIRSQLLAWERAGKLTVTDGDMTDYDAIERQIMVDASKFDLAEVAYDPWNAPQLVTHLTDGGLTVWPLQQTIRQLNAPSKHLEMLVGQDLLNDGQHPVLRWMASNAVTRGDTNGNIAPDKKKSTEKIDGIAALVDAIAAATRERDAAIVPMVAFI